MVTGNSKADTLLAESTVPSIQKVYGKLDQKSKVSIKQ